MTATVTIACPIRMRAVATIVTEAAKTRPDDQTAVVPAFNRDGKLPAIERDGVLPSIERDGRVEIERTGYLPEINRRERAD